MIEQLVRDGLDPSFHITAGPVWLTVIPEESRALPEYGWKLHISSRAAGLGELAQTILPVLAAAGCPFKLARSRRVLARLNDGITSPATVGKAVTVYPDQHQVSELGGELAELLHGWEGPRVLSDRRVATAAPVYYRYGPFKAGWESDGAGRLTTRVHGPDGEVFDGTATLSYRQPSWLADPFTGKPADGQDQGASVLGGHYQVTVGLHRAASGNVFQAVDLRDGGTVVIKQARALVAESDDQVDTRMRLRNERRVLMVLAGVAGVPRLLDHFRHGDDEFLVTSDCGPVSLAEDVFRHGPYGTAPVRRLDDLAVALARVLADVHGRGVIMRDLAPKNIVIGDAGPVVLDFGIARHDGLHLPGATPGFAPARQWRGELPSEADDYHALGMTLLFAATGMPPVVLGDDRDQPSVQARQWIGSRHGERPSGIIGLIADLLSDDEATVRAAFARLLSGRPGRSVDGRPAAVRLPVIGAFSTELAAQITGTLVSDLLERMEEVLHAPSGQPASHDASIYRGSSGIGLALLAHQDVPGTARAIADLGPFSVAAAERVKLPHGLFLGTTGVSVFLQRAAASGITVPAAPWRPPGPDWRPEDNDLVSGAAGAGLGHLWLHRASGDPAHLAVAVRCGEFVMTDAAPRSSWFTEARPAPGVDPSCGRAHGLAGVTEFLLALAERTGDQRTLTAAADHVRRLAERTRHLLPEAASSSTPSIAFSWCQGLAGIGQVLLFAGAVLDDPSLTDLAREAGDACIARVPVLSTLGRCCGAAGVGHFLIDLALAGQNERYWDAALETGRQMLLRSAGPPDHPIFAQDRDDRSGLAWAFGIAGLLPFFGRLAGGRSRGNAVVGDLWSLGGMQPAPSPRARPTRSW